MIVIVKRHEILLEKEEEINEKEVNISKCIFKFDDEITDEFVKKAIFIKDDKTILKVINNNECNYPPEILDSPGMCLIGVVATLTRDNKIVKRFNPTPKKFLIVEGTLREADNSQPITPSEFEQYMQALQDELNRLGKEVDNVVEQGNYAKAQGDYAKSQAENVINANKEATEIINTFEENVDSYTTKFNENASSKQTSYNNNAESKITAFNSNASDKLSTYNTNAETKLKAYDNNATSKLKEYNDNDDEKTSAYNTNTIDKTNEFNSNSETKLEEYNNNATQKIAEYDEHSQELNDKIIDTRNELERVKNDILETGEDTDTFVHLEDSAMAEYQELSVDGVCKQETTSGKNLFNVSQLPITLNGVTISQKSNGDVVLNGTPNITEGYISFDVSEKVLFKNLNTGYYTISVKEKKVGVGVISPFGGGALNLTLSDTISSKTANISTIASGTCNVNVRYDVGTLTDFILNPQLEYNPTATEYEPYTGGQPSPNPNYPQEIEVIEEDFNITSCGKNLYYGTSDNYSFTVNNRSWCDISGNNGMNGSDVGTKTVYKALVKKGETYTAMANVTGSNITNMGLIYDNEDPVYTLGFIWTEPHTFVAKKDGYVLFRFWINSSANIEVSNVQLEQGTVATDYEPYQSTKTQITVPENEFVGKIDDTYKDTLKVEYNEKDGQYHLNLYKNVGKYVLDGSDDENWTMYGESGKRKWYLNKRYFTNNNLEVPFENLVDKSNRFTVSAYIGGAWRKNIFGWHKSANSMVFDTDFGESLDEWKTWLSNNNVEVYYALSTPYVVDLGVVDMPITYNEITNLFTDSDLMPTINAKYYRNFISTIQNLQVNEKALKQELVDINARLSALESASANVVSEGEVVEQ